MRGTHNDLVITTAHDEATGTDAPLLHFPVKICKATDDDAKDVKFDIAAPSGAERKQTFKDTATDQEIDTEVEPPLKGIRTPDGFVEIPADQIDAIEEESKLVDMRVEKAEPLSSVPFDRAVGLYYLEVPTKSGAHKVYHLIYQALLPQKKGKKADKEALALRVKFTAPKRQKLGVVWADPERECLVLNVLAFGKTVRQPDEAVLAHKAVQVEQVQIDKARKVLVALKTPVNQATGEVKDVGDWDTPYDELIEKKRELMEQAAAGEKIAVKTPTKKADTVQADAVSDLLDASLAGVG